jgi:hypothetical protein
MDNERQSQTVSGEFWRELSFSPEPQASGGLRKQRTEEHSNVEPQKAEVQSLHLGSLLLP